MHRFCLIYPLLSFGFFVLLIQKHKSFLGQSGNLSHASVSVFFQVFRRAMRPWPGCISSRTMRLSLVLQEIERYDDGGNS
jgi:hypothetical protein